MTQTLDILVFAAHPDDAEIGMGGTILKHVRRGWRVGICDLTEAEMSSNGTVDIRRAEAAKASEALGIHYRSNLRLPDRGLNLVPEQIDALVREIRILKPRIVAAPYWKDRHPDHVMCSRLVQEAVFSAKLRKYMPELPPWTVGELFFYFINDLDEPDVIIDISAEQEGKMEALRSYRSQFELDGQDRVATPLNQGYLERVEARDRMLGARRLIACAEGFVSNGPLLLDLFGRN
jgi:bacillithiol biosynthesis deacetylase BshB1